MPVQTIRESLHLRLEEWEHLKAEAERLGTCAPTGRTAGQPTWRSLIKEIARGEILLTRAPEHDNT